MQLFSSRQVNAPIVVPQEFPVYRITGNGFYGVNDSGYDTLFTPGEILAYEDEPNVDMEPLNDLAVEAMRKFLGKLDNLGKIKAEKDNTAYVPLLDAFDRKHNAAGKVGRGRARSLSGNSEPSILGGQKRDGVRAVKIEADMIEEVPVVQVALSTSPERDNSPERDTANATTNKIANEKQGKLNG